MVRVAARGRSNVSYNYDDDDSDDDYGSASTKRKSSPKKSPSPKKKKTWEDSEDEADVQSDPSIESEDDMAYQDDEDDEDYGSAKKRKQKSPKKVSKKQLKKNAKSPRGKISASKKATPSKAKQSYTYVEISEDDLHGSVSEDAFDDDEDDDDYGSRKKKKSSPKKKSTPAKKGKKGSPKKSAGRPSKAVKTPTKKTPMKTPPRPSFPPVSEMVCESIRALKDNPKKGSSFATIKETILLNWDLDMNRYNKKIKKYILEAVEDGELIRTKGKGFSGRFAIPGMKVKRPKKRKNQAKLLAELDKNIDEVEYEAPRTARDEDREKHLAEMEEQRTKRKIEEELRAAEKAEELARRPKVHKPKQEEYEVECIKGRKEVRGELFYLVKWVGYNKPTWELEENVIGCDDLIRNWEIEDEIRKKDERDKWQAMQNTGEYEVARILDVKNYKNGTRDFLVRWKGFSAADDTWEPEDNLTCDDKIEAFLSRVESIYGVMKEERSLRVAPKKVSRLDYASSARQRKRNAGFRVTYEGMDDDR